MTDKFPVDAPKRKVIAALERLGFKLVREQDHISIEEGNLALTPLSLSVGG